MQLTKAYGIEPSCISVVINSGMYLLKIKLLDVNNLETSLTTSLVEHTVITLHTACTWSYELQYNLLLTN